MFIDFLHGVWRRTGRSVMRGLRMMPMAAALVCGCARTTTQVTAPQPAPAVVRGGDSLMERSMDARSVERQAAEYRISLALANAREAVASGRFSDAESALIAARAEMEADRQIFDSQSLRALNASVDQTREAIEAARQRSDAQLNAAARRESQTSAAQREVEERAEVKRTASSLTRTAQQLVYEGRYSQALGVLNQLQTVDPGDAYAIGVRPLVQDRAVLQEQRSYREAHDRQFASQLNGASEKLIPYNALLSYPANWPDIVEMRSREGGGVVKGDQTRSLRQMRL